MVPTYTPPNDAHVLRTRDTAGSRELRKHGVRIFRLRDGSEYVEAGSRERADLIREFSNGIPPLRLRRAEESYTLAKAARDAGRMERESGRRRKPPTNRGT